MRWSGKQTQGAPFKQQKCFAVITLAPSKKNFVQLYGSWSRNFTNLNSRESEPKENKARQSESGRTEKMVESEPN